MIPHGPRIGPWPWACAHVTLPHGSSLLLLTLAPFCCLCHPLSPLLLCCVLPSLSVVVIHPILPPLPFFGYHATITLFGTSLSGCSLLSRTPLCLSPCSLHLRLLVFTVRFSQRKFFASSLTKSHKPFAFVVFPSVRLRAPHISCSPFQGLSAGIFYTFIHPDFVERRLFFVGVLSILGCFLSVFQRSNGNLPCAFPLFSLVPGIPRP